MLASTSGARATPSRTRAPTSPACGPRRCCDGDDFVVNGQKIWTTLGAGRDALFLLVRTDKKAKKQDGISFLLVDLKTPGITVRPIRNIAGHEEFCEVFFDNVRVPRDEPGRASSNEGWTVAKALLGFERLGIGSPRQLAARAAAARCSPREWACSTIAVPRPLRRDPARPGDLASLYGALRRDA